MRILSFRGPCAPGGVSSALSQIYDNEKNAPEWWFIKDGCLRRKLDGQSEVIYPLDNQISQEHYLYCNNFLWPVLHDMPHLAHFSEEERRSYAAFNLAVAFRIGCAENISPTSTFINDYQFALCPTFLKGNQGMTVFWHIPWPKSVRPEFVQPIVDLANGLLKASSVGFHTNEYLYNFLSFVERHLPEYRVISKFGEISLVDKFSLAATPTKIFVSPLGLDANRWQAMSKLENINHYSEWQKDLPCVLSVDRADYTKGILERLNAIAQFLATNPQWHQKVTFLQLITRSREGLQTFDQYFESCRSKAAQVNALYSENGWEPIIWTDRSRTPIDLAGMYRRAAVMLVSPIRDGLNLTAKEYIACKNSRPGVLALSQGAGSWAELGDNSVEIIPEQPESFATAITRSLTMTEQEKNDKMRGLRAALAGNSLEKWWQNMQKIIKSEDDGFVHNSIMPREIRMNRQ